MHGSDTYHDCGAERMSVYQIIWTPFPLDMSNQGIAKAAVFGIIASNNTRHASPRCAPGGLLFCGVGNA